MLGWLGKILSKIYFCWTILHSFFFPLLTTLSTAGSSARLWIWKSHTWCRYCCLKIRPRKQTPEIRLTCRPTLVHYLGVSENSELGEEAIWSGGEGSCPGQGVSSRQEDGSSSSNTRSFWMRSNSGFKLFWSSHVDKPLGGRVLGNKCEKCFVQCKFPYQCEGLHLLSFCKRKNTMYFMSVFGNQAHIRTNKLRSIQFQSWKEIHSFHQVFTDSIWESGPGEMEKKHPQAPKFPTERGRCSGRGGTGDDGNTGWVRGIGASQPARASRNALPHERNSGLNTREEYSQAEMQRLGGKGLWGTRSTGWTKHGLQNLHFTDVKTEVRRDK